MTFNVYLADLVTIIGTQDLVFARSTVKIILKYLKIIFNIFLRWFCAIVFDLLIAFSIMMAYATLRIKQFLLIVGLRSLLLIQLIKIFKILTPGLWWAINLMIVRFLFYSFGFVLCYVIMEIFVIWFFKSVTRYYKALILQSVGFNKHPIMTFRDEWYDLSSDDFLNQTYDDDLIHTLTIKYVKKQDSKENSLYTISDDFLFSDDIDEQAISIALFIIKLQEITENSKDEVLLHQIEEILSFKIKLDKIITDFEKISTLSEFKQFWLDKRKILNSWEKIQVMHVLEKDIHLSTKYNKFFYDIINNFKKNINNSKEEVNILTKNINNSKEEVNNFQKNINNSKEEVNIFKKNINNFQEEVNIFKKNINNFQEEVNIFQKIINNSQDEVNNFFEEFNNFQEEVNILKKNINNSKEEVNILKKNINNSEVNNLKKNINNFQVNNLKKNINNSQMVKISKSIARVVHMSTSSEFSRFKHEVFNKFNYFEREKFMQVISKNKHLKIKWQFWNNITKTNS